MLTISFFNVVLPLNTMSDGSNVVDLSQTSTGYVISHEGFGRSNYGNNLRSQLILYNATDTMELIIDFIVFLLGTSDTCTTSQLGDTFRVLKASNRQPLYACGNARNVPGTVLIDKSTVDAVLMELTSDSSSNYGGVLLRYSGRYSLY